MAYLALLSASHLVRQARGTRDLPPPRAGLLKVELAAISGERTTGQRIELAYETWGERREGRPAVVLLHGSPGRSDNFLWLAPLLADEFFVVAPDLPGFGHSSRRIPDYSIRAHAGYLQAFLDELAVERAHLVGFSLGGGVALHAADEAPERFASVVLLSSIGLQEFELLGQYHLNRAVHALQLFGLAFLHEGFPHFGVFDGGMLDLPYARNFYDTDQRPLRSILDSIELPLLVIHGERDVLVPVEAAREHHRRVPQSELVLFAWENHFTVFVRPGLLAPPLRDFFERVESGAAPMRATASPERVAAAAEPPGPLPRIRGLALAVWMLLVASATLISEDLTCLAAGLIAAKGRVGFSSAVIASGVGIFVGDLLLYLAGRAGHRFLDRAPLRWFLRREDIETSQRWFKKRGGWVILLSRFLPGTRLPTYVTAGLLRMNPLWFTVQLLVPVVLWTPILVGAAYFFGERIFERFDAFERYALPGFLGALIAVWILVTLLRSLLTHRGRRGLVGWWRRKIHWEFWPLWFFYLPVVLYILWQGLKRRSPTLFTAANPGMPAGGGFVGESKSQILAALDPRWVARFRILPQSEARPRGEAVRSFMDEHGLDFPVVLKPDRGERGAGVKIARSRRDVNTFFDADPGDVIVQEYIEGKELGIFYIRLPGEERGQIFAITDKVLPSLRGDGKRSLRRLILDDRRAVAMAKAYFEARAEILEEVPAAGENVPLVEIGTHCRGAIFGDGGRYKTPELEAAVEEMSRSFQGFYFGRYDVRAPSGEAYKEGRDLKVLELNGVSSEATNIYDPKYSLRAAYKILFAQWRLAFEVGERNRERGARPLPVLELMRMVFRASSSRS